MLPLSTCVILSGGVDFMCAMKLEYMQRHETVELLYSEIVRSVCKITAD